MNHLRNITYFSSSLQPVPHPPPIHPASLLTLLIPSLFTPLLTLLPILPLYHPCSLSPPPLYHPCSRPLIPPLYQPWSSSAYPLYHPCSPFPPPPLYYPCSPCPHPPLYYPLPRITSSPFAPLPPVHLSWLYHPCSPSPPPPLAPLLPLPSSSFVPLFIPLPSSPSLPLLLPLPSSPSLPSLLPSLYPLSTTPAPIY